MSRPPVEVKAGTRFGRLLVLADRQAKEPTVLVRCDCGTEKRASVAELRRAKNPLRSCGCASREALELGRRFEVRHGNRRRGRTSPLYELWRDLRRRYPGEVCKRWQDSFEAFAFDLGPKPPGRRLARHRDDRPWSPRNCGWVSVSYRGEKNPQAKLTPADADRIRMLVASGIPQTRVARRFGVSSSHVSRIVRRAA